MPLPLNIIDLAITDEISDDSAEVARRLDQAADLVEGFAEQSGLAALEGLLNAASKAETAGPTRALAEKALRISHEVTEQSGVLHCEVERFISVSSRR
ncbi:hypothetical protein [Pelagibius sp.]|uniref:hypothetical protein n=1 Tax=Pelagibius sp. TaxID=1931238 RepID=UPI0026237E84|nr:hypothetical protein [Pelagibius sp.]